MGDIFAHRRNTVEAERHHDLRADRPDRQRSAALFETRSWR
jgi:hypothetical protein